MRFAPVLALSACLPSLPVLDDPCAPFPEPGLYLHRVDTDDGGRKAYVYVPEGSGPRDLIVALHGAGESASDFGAVTRFMAASEEQGGGYVSVFPQGKGFPLNAWNAGDCCGGVDEHNGDVDDVAFLDQLVDEVVPLVCGARVLATGFSNGAMLAHRWACRSDRVDGAMPVSGPLLVDACDGPPLPIRHVHGLADTRVPFSGGGGDGLGGNVYPPVDETMAIWQTRNGCDTTLAPVEDIRGETTCTTWSCTATTTLCTVAGWDHRWPGGIHADALTSDATTDAWSWFQDQADGTTPAPLGRRR